MAAPVDPFRLDGRCAVVVGAGPNIGVGLALALAEAGARVATVDAVARTAALAADEVGRAGGDALPVTCDVTDPEAVDRAFTEICAWGEPTILVNAAGSYREEGLLDMHPDDWSRLVAVILTGTFLFTRRVARRLVEEGAEGSVINVASSAAHQGQAGNIAYCSAKAGLLNFTRSAAVELAPHRIRVNTLTPTGTSLEEMAGRAAAWDLPAPSPEQVARKERSTALAPLGLPNPHDYGLAAVYLASDAARFVTGAELRVDAGCLAKYWAQP